MSTKESADLSDRDQHPITPATTFREGAIFWHAFGLDVIPVTPGTKQTAVKWNDWLQHLSERQIAHYWREHPNHELGFIVGDGVVVLDADSPNAVAAMIEAERRLGTQPSMIVKTTRGEHHYFLRPAGLPCKTAVKVVGEAHDRIDVKTGRTMVILPPSPGKLLVTFGGRHA